MDDSQDPSTSGDVLRAHGIARDDWEFCRTRLTEVSRTFSKPIAILPGTLEISATCGYLLCRIADTIEDHPSLPFERKRDLFQRFLAVVESGELPSTFTDPFGDVPGDGPEHRLAGSLDRIMEVFLQLPKSVVRSTKQRVGEMSRGMLTYERRRDWSDGLATVATLRDLERYCYYVAGTVGHLMTELFIHQIEPVAFERRHEMREHAEHFGLGLQMVNLLKDQTDDYDEGWCFMPELPLSRRHLAVEDLFDPECRSRAHAAIEPVFERAREHLDAALEYTLALPPEARRIRIACLLPLWLAVRTLVHARGNDAMFEPGEPVKISRDSVARLAADCREHAADGPALRQRYHELWQTD